MIKVKALKPGYYDAQRRRVGDVFELRDDEARGTWMGDVDAPIIEKSAMPLTSNVKGTTAAGNINKERKPPWEEPVGESLLEPQHKRPALAEDAPKPVKRKTRSRSGKSSK